MLINHFKFRSDILSYHLGGMGCGNGALGNRHSGSPAVEVVTMLSRLAGSSMRNCIGSM
jgi:hypothetical protein